MAKSKYKLTLETSGNIIEATGDDIYEALGNLGLDWHDIKAKGVIKVEKGDKKFEKLFIIKLLRRIFANKETRLIWAKRLEYLIK